MFYVLHVYVPHAHEQCTSVHWCGNQKRSNVFVSCSPLYCLEKWSTMNLKFPISWAAWSVSSWETPVYASKCWGYTATFVFFPVFIFMCLCGMHLRVYVGGHVCVSACVCGYTSRWKPKVNIGNHLPSITLPPYWLRESLSIKPILINVASLSN